MAKMTYEYSEDKNKFLINERHISFEEIIAALDNGQLLDVVEHPNRKKYPDQNMYVIHINGYIYLVPFVQKNKRAVFLKTIFPSRKAKKQYIKDGGLQYEQKKN